MLKMILCVLVMGTLMAGEETSKLPANVTAIIDKAEQEITKNRFAYDRANDRVFVATEKALQSELDKLTKAGKLEEALAVKKTIESLRTDMVNKVDEEAKSDLLGVNNVNTSKFLTSRKWRRFCRWGDWDCDFNTDGTATVGEHAARWVIEEDTLKVTFVKNPNWFMHFKRKGDGFEGVLDEGSKVTMSVRK
jgi:hypothetical protein